MHFDFGEFGKFPWGEIAANTLGIVMSYFAGRYRSISKNQKRRIDD